MRVRMAQLVRVVAPVWQFYYLGFESHQVPNFFTRMLVWIGYDVLV